MILDQSNNWCFPPLSIYWSIVNLQWCVSGVQQSDSNIYIYISLFQIIFHSVHFSSITQLCPTLRYPMNRSTSGLLVLHQLQNSPNPCPLCWWCHPTISSSIIPFSSCPQSFLASGSFPMSQFFVSECPKYWSFSYSISNDMHFNFILRARGSQW